MKLLAHSVVLIFLSVATWASASIIPGDENWPTNYPEWWYNAGNPASSVIDVTQPILNQNNNAPLVTGQLKNVAVQARDELDSVLISVGGAGTEIDTLVNSFTTVDPSNLSPANIGQLKNVSSKYFDRLAEVGFAPGMPGWPVDLILDEGVGDNSPLYPWLNDVAAANAAPANLGQLKHLFSWNIREYASLDSDTDNLPDWWELYWFQTLTQTASDDTDGDGQSNAQEYTLGTNSIENTSKVEFKLGSEGLLLDGDLIQFVGYGGKAIAPSLSIASGSRFIGWDKSFHDVTGSIIITAQYESLTQDHLSAFADRDGDRLANQTEVEVGSSSSVVDTMTTLFGTNAKLGGDLAITLIGHGTFTFDEVATESTLRN